VDDAALVAGRVDAAFVDLMRFQISRARALYAQGNAGLAAIPNDGSRFTAGVMATVYGGILDAIEAQNYDVFSRRARLNGLQKIRRLLTAWRLTRRPRAVAASSPAGAAE
jgi:15-cis-phytoene synthase